jgi:tetratricopeptide (TPR) repeat protein
MILMRRKLTVGSHVVLAFGIALASVVATTVPADAKGEPQPSKCDKLKRNSPEWKRCVGQAKDDLSDNELYYAGYWLSRTGEYALALDYLGRAKVKDARILTYIGFATRKLGDHDAAMRLYGRALALDPSYTVARAYLGEALVGRGDIAAAKVELSAIEGICGTTCADYQELARQIVDAEKRL